MPMACGAAPADVSVTYRTSRGSRVTIEASSNGWGRVEEVGTSTQPVSYGLVTPDGRNLTVFRHGSRWVVADAADYSGWPARPNEPASSSSPQKHQFVAAGEEQIGSWRGQAYQIRPTCGSRSSFVVMRGGGYEALENVLRKNLTYGATKAPGMPKCEFQAIKYMTDGLLLRADEMVLESVRRGKIDASRFKPPAPLLSRKALFDLLGRNQPLRLQAPSQTNR